MYPQRQPFAVAVLKSSSGWVQQGRPKPTNSFAEARSAPLRGSSNPAVLHVCLSHGHCPLPRGNTAPSPPWKV